MYWREAIENVKLNEYDLIFLDVVLPGMNGIEASRFIKGNSPATKIIFMSGYIRADFVSDEVRHVFKDNNLICLNKPFKEGQLLEVSKSALNEKISVIVET